MHSPSRLQRAVATVTLLAITLQMIVLPAAGVRAAEWSASWGGEHGHIYLGGGPVPEHDHAYDAAASHVATPAVAAPATAAPSPTTVLCTDHGEPHALPAGARTEPHAAEPHAAETDQPASTPAEPEVIVTGSDNATGPAFLVVAAIVAPLQRARLSLPHDTPSRQMPTDAPISTPPPPPRA